MHGVSPKRESSGIGMVALGLVHHWTQDVPALNNNRYDLTRGESNDASRTHVEHGLDERMVDGKGLQVDHFGPLHLVDTLRGTQGEIMRCFWCLRV